MNTKNVKVTMKNSKEQMLSFLEATYPTIAENNKDVAERVEFTLSNHEKAKKSEVFEVVEEVQEVLMTMPEDVPTEEEEPATIEDEVNKSPKKPKVQKSEPVENEVKKPAPAKAKAKPKPATKKTEEKEKSEPVVKESPQPGTLPIAAMFPEELTVKTDDGDIKLKAVPDTYKDVADVAKALSSGKRFYFVCYWTPRHIKQHHYAASFALPKDPKSFPNNLDILEPVLYSESINRIWASSIYTEAMLYFEKEDIEHITDKNPYNGEEFRIRVSNGLEFEIYEEV